MSIEDTHNEILRSLGSLSSDVSNIKEQVTYIRSDNKDIRDKVSNLEIESGKTSVKMGIIGAIAGTITAGIVSMFTINTK